MFGIFASLICDTFINQSIIIRHPAFKVCFDKPLFLILSLNSYVNQYVKSSKRKYIMLGVLFNTLKTTSLKLNRTINKSCHVDLRLDYLL